MGLFVPGQGQQYKAYQEHFELARPAMEDGTVPALDILIPKENIPNAQFQQLDAIAQMNVEVLREAIFQRQVQIQILQTLQQMMGVLLKLSEQLKPKPEPIGSITRVAPPPKVIRKQ